jgi:nitroreductase/NAD-dependent dihydropyrimidine dehydrogenase PreA subunit
MDRRVNIEIEPDVCIGCGECVRVCQPGTISLSDDQVARVTGDDSSNCGHCAAVCPTGAIRLPILENDQTIFQAFELDRSWLPHGAFDQAQLARLMASRRSCRNYKPDPVPPGVIEDLIKFGTLAPSGTNAQEWTFTVLPDRDRVLMLADEVLRFFERVNRMAEKKWLTKALKWIGKPALERYRNNYHQAVSEAIAEYRDTGRERLFHGATAAILIGSGPEASCPAEDALLAAGNILLAAHAYGLGTCLIGFVVEALKNDPSIKPKIDVPQSEPIHAVIALGWPDERYQSVTGRFKVQPRWVGGAGKRV